MANESLYVPPFIKSVMAADSALVAAIPATRHHHRRAPQDGVFPCIVYRYHDGFDVTTENKRRLIANQIFQIFVAVKIALDSNARTAVNRIEALFGEDNLRRRAYTAPDSTALTFNSWRDDMGTINREQEGAKPEEPFIHVGAFYRFEIFN